MKSDDGFTLIETVATLAIVALLAAVALPNLPHGTTRAQLEALAFRAAALMKADRNAALSLRRPVVTGLNPARGEIVSGAGAGALRLPADVTMEAVVARVCAGVVGGSGVAFLANGLSCGGAVTLARPGAAYRLQVNWLTGGVEVAVAEPRR